MSQRENLSNLNSNIFFNPDSHLKLVCCAKTQLTFQKEKFENNYNLKVKLLFRDSTGYIEAIAYDRVALSMNKIKLQKLYTLSNFRLKSLPVERKQWPNQELNATFEIQIESEESIMPSEDYEKKIKHTAMNKEESEMSGTFKEPLPLHPVISSSIFRHVDNLHILNEQISKNYGNNLTKYTRAKLVDDALLESGVMKPPEFICMREINCCIPIGTVVNTFGVIVRRDEATTSKSIQEGSEIKDLRALNIYINDTSNYCTRVCIWDIQVENFIHPVGTVLMFFDLEVLTFNKEITLNLTRRSRFMSIEKSYEIEKAELIRNWYLSQNINRVI